MKDSAPLEQPSPATAKTFTAVTFLIMLFVLTRIALPFIQPIFWAGILAIAFYPLYDILRTRFKWKESRAAAFVSILIVLTVVPLFIFGVTKAAQQAKALAASTRESIRTGEFQQRTNQFLNQTWARRGETSIFGQNVLKEKIPQWSEDTAQNVGKFAAEHAAAITKSFFVTVAAFVLMLFLLYIFLRDGRRIARYITQLIPLEPHHREKVLSETHHATQAVVQGIFAMAVMKGILCTILFLCVGIAIAPLLGFAAFFSSLLPFIGATAVWLPVGLSLLFQGAHVKAIIVFAVGLLIINSVDNVMQPLIVGKKMKMPYALLMLAMLGGMLTFGVSGLFIGPVVLSLFFVLVPIYREKFFRHEPTELEEPRQLAA